MGGGVRAGTKMVRILQSEKEKKGPWSARSYYHYQDMVLIT